MTGKPRILLLAAFVVASFLVKSSVVMAAGEPPAPQAQGGSVYENTIANSSYSLGLQAGYGVRLWDHPRLEVAQALPSVAFPISGVKGRSSWYRGIWEYKIEGVFGIITNLADRAEAGLCPVGIKYNFTEAGTRLVPYAELLLGALYYNVPRAVQGTKFEFVEKAGLGVQYFITRGTAVNFEARFEHVSNAGIREPNRGVNSGFLLAGLCFY